MAEIQQRRFQKLLRRVLTGSAFYRDYYGSHGIRERGLTDVTVRDLPFLTKATLMEQFDRAVIDSRLKRVELEAWLDTIRDPRQAFLQDFIVMHSSGSSGVTGIFVYSRTDWQVMNSVMATRLPKPENYPNEKTRVAFYRATHGHFAGVATALHLPKAVYETLIVSCLDPVSQVNEQLQAFDPQRLTGYSSSIALLAEEAIEGRLRIRPQRVFVSGDLLTERSRQKIKEAWSAPITNLYGASESLFLAIQDSEDEMTVMSDLNILEILDENNRSVEPGEDGRVVITNLYNHTLPILRYELGDYVTCGDKDYTSSASSIRAIRPGKANDALPVLLDSGSPDTISPRALTSFYARGIERVQFISLRDGQVRVDYVARRNIDNEVRKEFQRILSMKGAARTTFEVRQVPTISADPKTGKVRLVVRDGGQAQQDSHPGVNDLLSKTVRLPRISQQRSFVAFQQSDIEQSVSDRFEQQVEKYAVQPAIGSGALVLTYDALNRVANRVAQAILARRSQGCEPVALLLEQGAMAVAAVLGILKAGRFYLALDPSYPQPWLAAMLEDSRAPLLVTDRANLHLALTLIQRSDGILNIDDLDTWLPDRNPGLPIAPDSLAYLFYTSGSTGRPRGVVQTHRNVLHQIASYTNGLKLTPADRCTLLHSHCFSASRLDIFGALLNGARLLPFPLINEGTATLASWLLREEVTVFHWVPTGFRHFVDGMNSTEQFPKVRVVVLGSEPVSVRDVVYFKKHFGQACVLVNRYGTTETGNISWFFIRKDTQLVGNTVPVGYPIDETKVFLLDQAGQEVGYDQRGEIAVRSRYLSPGYWHGGDPTGGLAPALSGSLERTYRTGDIGCMRPDGCLLHLGRKDLQAKIRGYRIEVGQVEAALLEHPAVREAAVMVREDGAERRNLVAYIVANRDYLLTNTELRKFLKTRLPAYMMPSEFVQLESLPLTPSGKLDRRALAKADGMTLATEAPFAAPSSPIEKAVARIWMSVLGVNRIGLHDTFFDLGGHSLLASALLSRIADEFGVAITLRELFEQPTLGQITKVINRSHEQTFQDTRLACVLSDVESLSEEEAREVLKDDRK
ncbi:MAG: AMP-binding protein [Chloroflexota bacterium]